MCVNVKLKKTPPPPPFLLSSRTSSNTNTQPFLITQPADFISASRQKCKLFGVILIYTIPRKEQKKEKEKKGYPLFFFFLFSKNICQALHQKKKGKDYLSTHSFPNLSTYPSFPRFSSPSPLRFPPPLSFPSFSYPRTLPLSHLLPPNPYFNRILFTVSNPRAKSSSLWDKRVLLLLLLLLQLQLKLLLLSRYIPFIERFIVRCEK